MNQHSEGLFPAHIFFPVVIAAMALVVLLAWRMRVRDRKRTEANARRFQLRPTDGLATDPALATIWEAATADELVDHHTDTLALVGLGNALTRRRTTTTRTPAQVLVNDRVAAGTDHGLAAVIRTTSRSKTTGVMTHSTSTVREDIVVARLARPIAGSLQGVPQTPVRGFDLAKGGRLAAAFAASGMLCEPIGDTLMNRCFTPRSDIDELLAGDEMLRALLWAIRPSEGTFEATAETARYESLIPPMHFLQLGQIQIHGDLLVLHAGASPFRASASQRLIDLADHLTTWFR